jgi:arabinose-5-phosphate isomerase
MHTGEAIPVVLEAARLRDVVLEMTRGHFGMTTVIDGAGRLVGVITDGDLRRLHLGDAPVTALTAGGRQPSAKVIGADDLTAKALPSWSLRSRASSSRRGSRQTGSSHAHITRQDR